MAACAKALTKATIMCATGQLKMMLYRLLPCLAARLGQTRIVRRALSQCFHSHIRTHMHTRMGIKSAHKHKEHMQTSGWTRKRVQRLCKWFSEHVTPSEHRPPVASGATQRVFVVLAAPLFQYCVCVCVFVCVCLCLCVSVCASLSLSLSLAFDTPQYKILYLPWPA